MATLSVFPYFITCPHSTALQCFGRQHWGWLMSLKRIYFLNGLRWVYGVFYSEVTFKKGIQYNRIVFWGKRKVWNWTESVNIEKLLSIYFMFDSLRLFLIWVSVKCFDCFNNCLIYIFTLPSKRISFSRFAEIVNICETKVNSRCLCRVWLVCIKVSLYFNYH